MLILTRQVNEAIMIGDDVEISVVEIKAGKIKIGISAPKDVSVHRKEVYLEIKERNLAAAQGQLEDLPEDVMAKFSALKTAPSRKRPEVSG